MAIGVPLMCAIDFRMIQEPVRWALGFFVALCAISLIATPDIYAGTLDLLLFTFLIGVMVLGASLDRLDEVMIGCGYGLAISSLISVLQWLGWSPVEQSNSPAGLFFNSGPFAEFAALIFVWMAVKGRWVLAGLAVLPIVLCEGRTAFVAACAGLLAAWKADWWKKGILLGVVLFLAIAAVALLRPASSYHRVILWGATAMAITPLGRGLGWFQAAHPFEEFAHSDVLQTFAEVGIGAAILAVIPYLALSARGYVAERAVFVAVVVEVVFSFPLHMPATGFVAAIVTGYLVSVRAALPLGSYNGRDQNEVPARRRNAANHRNFGHSGRLGVAISDRSISESKTEMDQGARVLYPGEF